jgi:hypothetical protein
MVHDGIAPCQCERDGRFETSPRSVAVPDASGGQGQAGRARDAITILKSAAERDIGFLGRGQALDLWGAVLIDLTIRPVACGGSRVKVGSTIHAEGPAPR